MERRLRLAAARCILVLVATMLGTVAGCAPSGANKVTVHGTITYQGQPLKAGLIAFHGPGEAYTTAPVQPNGTFTAELTPGEVTVSIMETPGGSKARPAANAPNMMIPEKYASRESSDLRYTITPSTAKLTIELKTP